MKWTFGEIIFRIACIAIFISAVLSMVCTWISILSHDFYKMLSSIMEVVTSVAYIIFLLGSIVILIFCVVLYAYLYFKKK